MGHLRRVEKNSAEAMCHELLLTPVMTSALEQKFVRDFTQPQGKEGGEGVRGVRGIKEGEVRGSGEREG